MLHVGTGKTDPLPEDQEIAMLRDWYDNRIPKHAKRKHDGDERNYIKPYSWETFEDFLKSQERLYSGKEEKKE